MLVSVLIGSFGDEAWRDLAQQQAVPSAEGQGAAEVLWRHEDDGTLASVRNAAAEAATGDWLCFLDADDRLGDGYVGAMFWASKIDAPAEHVVDPESDRKGGKDWGLCRARDDPRGCEWWPGRWLLVPAVQYVRDGRCVGEPAIPNKGGWPEVNECVIGTLIPRALFLDVGGFRETLNDRTPLNSLEDYDLFLRCWDAGARLIHVPAAVYCAMVHDDGRNADQSVYPAIWAEHLSRCREVS